MADKTVALKDVLFVTTVMKVYLLCLLLGDDERQKENGYMGDKYGVWFTEAEKKNQHPS